MTTNKLNSLSDLPLLQSDFDTLGQHVISILNQDIKLLIAHANLPFSLENACLYAVTGPGKRVRPLLVACTFNTVIQTSDSIDLELNKNSHYRRAMLAVEFLHTYSLIHDDLPCMDDDDLRRGRSTCHIEFDEATALLAGDVLQTLAFEVLTADIEGFAPISPLLAMQLCQVFLPRARRMVSGQMLDLNAENKLISQVELEKIHRDKTGALIEAAVLMGALCADATIEQQANLSLFASHIGLAFQVQDDILDVTSNTDTLGKPTGSDEGLNKSTYVKLMGVEKASDYAKSLFILANEALNQNFNEPSPLKSLADWLWTRRK